MTPSRTPDAPQASPQAGPFGYGLTIDVEEWYHTCLVPEFVDVGHRPRLPRELDRLLPELLELFWAKRVRATFFVLGEVAREVPARVQELALAGHEIASHGYHHRRIGDLTRERFLAEARDSKALLEDLVGQQVIGFRAPEWSMRTVVNPRLRLLAELGYRYDSSLAPWPGAGSRRNPRHVIELQWSTGEALLELPPLSFGGRLSLPGSGWPARLASPEQIARAAGRCQHEGGLPVIVAHPWELSGAPTPGELTGLARALHEVGRPGYRLRFARLLEAHPWGSLREALQGRPQGGAVVESAPGEEPDGVAVCGVSK